MKKWQRSHQVVLFHVSIVFFTRNMTICTHLKSLVRLLVQHKSHKNVGVQPLVSNQVLIKQARELLIRQLTRVCFNDALAAEFLLLHFISKIHSRSNAGINIGKFNLNFSHVPLQTPQIYNQFTSNLQSLYSALLPASYLFNMSKENLNSMFLFPRKDFSSNKLVSGLLQLCSGTHLIVNEAALTQGNINAQALKNIQALEILLSQQVVNLDFQYHNVVIQTDLPVLVLSEGKSVFASLMDAIVPLKLFAADNGENVASADDINLLREYIFMCKHVITEQFKIDEEANTNIQQDFVTSRKEDPSITQYSLHSWLTMARLLALSMGQTILTPEVWKHMRVMDKERSLRVKAAFPVKK